MQGNISISLGAILKTVYPSMRQGRSLVKFIHLCRKGIGGCLDQLLMSL
ncbi:MAG: hypothetical protein ACI9LL_000540 [Porticoccus sp.]|jgi:hypothetical protein